MPVSSVPSAGERDLAELKNKQLVSWRPRSTSNSASRRCRRGLPSWVWRGTPQPPVSGISPHLRIAEQQLHPHRALDRYFHSLPLHRLLKDDPYRVMFRQFQGAIAQCEKANIVLKLRGARQRMKARTGRCEGRKPYGANEGEQAIIARMKELRASGMAYDRIRSEE